MHSFREVEVVEMVEVANVLDQHMRFQVWFRAVMSGVGVLRVPSCLSGPECSEG